LFRTLPVGQLGAALEMAGGNSTGRALRATLRTFTACPRTAAARLCIFLTIVNGGGGNVVKMKLINFAMAPRMLTAWSSFTATGRCGVQIVSDWRAQRGRGGVSDFYLAHGLQPFQQFDHDLSAVGQSGLVGQKRGAGKVLAIPMSSGAATTVYTAQGNNQIIGVATDSDESIFGVAGFPKCLYR